MVKIAPSILSADYSDLARQMALAESGGADMFHVDVMDGHFVPNITIGPVVLQAVRRCTKLPIDVHLMVSHPENFIKMFALAGADYLTVHIEADHSMKKTLAAIRSSEKKPGIVLNPSTALRSVFPHLGKVDLLLVMTVKPGFPGQKFIPEVLPKIEAARKYIDEKKLKVELEVDGGIDVKTAPLVTKAGADILVAGSAIFGGRVMHRVRALREAAED